MRAQPSVDGSGRASTVPVAAKRMRCPSGPRACRSASSATLRCSRLACARLNEGPPALGALGLCDFLVFFFSVEAPPLGNVVPGEVYSSFKGPLRGLNLRSGQPPSAAHSCAAASNPAIGLGLTPATEDAAAAEPARAASRRSSRTRRAPATMTTPCLKSVAAAFLGEIVPPRMPPFSHGVLTQGSASFGAASR